MNLNGTANPSTPALFVSPAPVLRTSGRVGGVQICTREYMDTLREAGYNLRVLGYDPDRRFLTRVRKTIWPRPYANNLPPELAERILAEARAGVETIFLNLVDLTPLAARLKRGLGAKAKIVLLSHGLESVDYLHFLRARGFQEPFHRLGQNDLLTLSRKLVAECEHRRHIDHVFCLAPFEAEMERWLGARRVDWLPRTIPDHPVNWQPRYARLGYVGTLDHPPNAEGLVLFLRAFRQVMDPLVRVRLVGGPVKKANELAAQFPFLDYLGALSDRELHEEAGTWNAFLHPMFCYARGCSTKLAVALGWQIPVLTTPSGCRGYVWREGVLPLADTPEELARLAVNLLDPENAYAARDQITAVVRSSPTLAEVAAKVRAALTCQPTEVAH
jgi:glycosyltransferase involved in cell wall biosynthesis